MEQEVAKTEKASTSVFDMFGTDAKMERSGIYLDYGSFRLLVARAGGSNAKFARVLESVSKPYRRAMELGSLSNEKAQEILTIVYARAVVLGWEGEGLVDQDGNPLEYNEKNVIWLFTQLPDLFADVQAQVVKMDNFRRVAREDETKN